MAISRRDVLKMGAAGAALSLMDFKAAYAQAADTITLALAAAGPRQLDPNFVTQGPDNWAAEQVFEQLVRPADGEFGSKPTDFQATLAESWTSSPDARTWTFKLRKGVQFHGGYGEMTSADVVFTFDRCQHVGTRQTLFANIASTEAPDPYTFVIHLTNPDPLLLGSVVFTSQAGIVSKKAVEERGEKFKTNSIGTGPYKLDRFDAQSGVYLSAFDGYWGDKAKTPKLAITYIADTTARTLALLSGQVDMIEGVRAPGWIASMKQRKSSLQFDMTVPGSFNTLFFNLKRKPMDNLSVRKAIAYAIDRDSLNKALDPMAGPLYGLQPPEFPAGFDEKDYPEDLRYAFDQDKARAALKDAGYPNGLTFENVMSQREDYSSSMLIVQDQLREVGINMNMKIVDHTTFHADCDQDANSFFMIASSYPPIPLQLDLDYLSSASEVKPDGKGGSNYSHYGVVMPGVDDLIQKASQATDFDQYVDICKQIDLQVRRDLPMLGLGTLSYVIARNARVDIGYPVKSGYARWRLHKATIKA